MDWMTMDWFHYLTIRGHFLENVELQREKTATGSIKSRWASRVEKDKLGLVQPVCLSKTLVALMIRETVRVE